jgi:hypothetical protein
MGDGGFLVEFGAQISSLVQRGQILQSDYRYILIKQR